MWGRDGTLEALRTLQKQVGVPLTGFGDEAAGLRDAFATTTAKLSRFGEILAEAVAVTAASSKEFV